MPSMQAVKAESMRTGIWIPELTPVSGEHGDTQGIPAFGRWPQRIPGTGCLSRLAELWVQRRDPAEINMVEGN
jgi:hypothetical protein